MRTLFVAAVFPLLAACGPKPPQSPYIMIVHISGRVYFGDLRNSLSSETGGFLSFRDMVTGESVRIQQGTFSTKETDWTRIEQARKAYMYNPSNPPNVKDLSAEEKQGLEPG